MASSTFKSGLANLQNKSPKIFKIYSSIFGDETWICKSCGVVNNCEYSYCRNGCK